MCMCMCMCVYIYISKVTKISCYKKNSKCCWQIHLKNPVIKSHFPQKIIFFAMLWFTVTFIMFFCWKIVNTINVFVSLTYFTPSTTLFCRSPDVEGRSDCPEPHREAAVVCRSGWICGRSRGRQLSLPSAAAGRHLGPPAGGAAAQRSHYWR